MQETVTWLTSVMVVITFLGMLWKIAGWARRRAEEYAAVGNREAARTLARSAARHADRVQRGGATSLEVTMQLGDEELVAGQVLVKEGHMVDERVRWASLRGSTLTVCIDCVSPGTRRILDQVYGAED